MESSWKPETPVNGVISVICDALVNARDSDSSGTNQKEYDELLEALRRAERQTKKHFDNTPLCVKVGLACLGLKIDSENLPGPREHRRPSLDYEPTTILEPTTHQTSYQNVSKPNAPLPLARQDAFVLSPGDSLHREFFSGNNLASPPQPLKPQKIKVASFLLQLKEAFGLIHRHKSYCIDQLSFCDWEQFSRELRDVGLLRVSSGDEQESKQDTSGNFFQNRSGELLRMDGQPIFQESSSIDPIIPSTRCRSNQDRYVVMASASPNVVVTAQPAGVVPWRDTAVGINYEEGKIQVMLEKLNRNIHGLALEESCQLEEIDENAYLKRMLTTTMEVAAGVFGLTVKGVVVLIVLFRVLGLHYSTRWAILSFAFRIEPALCQFITYNILIEQKYAVSPALKGLNVDKSGFLEDARSCGYPPGFITFLFLYCSSKDENMVKEVLSYKPKSDPSFKFEGSDALIKLVTKRYNLGQEFSFFLLQLLRFELGCFDKNPSV
jgi:hypothetical protein